MIIILPFLIPIQFSLRSAPIPKPYKADLNCWINCVAVLPEYPP